MVCIHNKSHKLWRRILSLHYSRITAGNVVVSWNLSDSAWQATINTHRLVMSVCLLSLQIWLIHKVLSEHVQFYVGGIYGSQWLAWVWVLLAVWGWHCVLNLNKTWHIFISASVWKLFWTRVIVFHAVWIYSILTLSYNILSQKAVSS